MCFMKKSLWNWIFYRLKFDWSNYIEINIKIVIYKVGKKD